MNDPTLSDPADALDPIKMEHKRISKAFGLVLKAARAANGLSQEAQSRVIGIDRSYESMLERGKQCPTLAMLLRIAKGLNVSAGELLDKTLHHLEREEHS